MQDLGLKRRNRIRSQHFENGQRPRNCPDADLHFLWGGVPRRRLSASGDSELSGDALKCWDHRRDLDAIGAGGDSERETEPKDGQHTPGRHFSLKV